MSKNTKNVSSQGVPNRDINAATRAVTALALRAQKLTYAEIASIAGYSDPSACRKAVMREMDRCVVKNVDTLRSEELYILDRLHGAVWPLVFPDTAIPDNADEDEDEDEPTPPKKKPKLNLFALDRLVAISEARRKLMGLDTPIDKTLVGNMVIVQEVPQGYLSAPEVKV
jgi:hypothetical protein